MSTTSIAIAAQFAAASILGQRDTLSRAALMLRAHEATGKPILLRHAIALLVKAHEGMAHTMELKNEWCYPEGGGFGADQATCFKAKGALEDLYTELDRLQRIAAKADHESWTPA
tara:strand:- start:2027 stop:2371 length:345 start_codon:yes stop_codon:yes gene_type:complete